MIKQIPNMITILRMLCSALLLLFKPRSVIFVVIYAICGLSDILDGYIARRLKVTTSFGATLDSIADIIFWGTVLVIFVPLLQWQWWLLVFIGVTTAIRLLSIGIGFAKFHTLGCLHTYANKTAGALLFLLPIIYAASELTMTILTVLLCKVALLSAIDELAIMLMSKELHKNIRCVFDVLSQDDL